MTAFIATVRRELASLWLTTLAWLLLIPLILLQGGVFSTIITSFATNPSPLDDIGPLQAFYGQSIFVPLTLLFTCPALTMRAFAEERRSGTMENLLSAPVTSTAIVLGKFVAALTSFFVMWAPTLLYPVILRSVITVDWRAVVASYLGILCIGGSLIAVGILCSTMSRTQFLSLVLTSGVLLALVLLGVGENVFDEGWLQSLCGHLSIQAQLAEFSQGIVSLRRLVFDGALGTLALFLSIRVVDSWRWS